MPGNVQATNRGDGTIAFDDITFGIDDIGKTYEYEVTEVVPEALLITVTAPQP